MTICFLAADGKNLTAAVVDYCDGCDEFSVGLSDTGFEHFAPLDQGIVHNVTWHIN